MNAPFIPNVSPALAFLYFAAKILGPNRDPPRGAGCRNYFLNRWPTGPIHISLLVGLLPSFAPTTYLFSCLICYYHFPVLQKLVFLPPVPFCSCCCFIFVALFRNPIDNVVSSTTYTDKSAFLCQPCQFFNNRTEFFSPQDIQLPR